MKGSIRYDNRYGVLGHKLCADIVPQVLLEIVGSSELQIFGAYFRDKLSIPLCSTQITISIGNILGKNAGDILLLYLGLFNKNLDVSGKKDEYRQTANDQKQPEAIKQVRAVLLFPSGSRVLQGLLHGCLLRYFYSVLRYCGSDA